MIKIQTEDFDVGTVVKELRQQSNNIGAIVTFTGLVREFGSDEHINAMTLEHYPGMTEKTLKTIVNDAKTRWNLLGAQVLHRVGTLYAGDNIVLVATASEHRKDAFEAAQYIMDFLKSEAPFWKKEHTDKGDHWVEAKKSDRDAKENW